MMTTMAPEWPSREEVKKLLVGTRYEGGEYLYWDFNPDDPTSHQRATVGNYNHAGFKLIVDAMRNAAMVQSLLAQLAELQDLKAQVDAFIAANPHPRFSLARNTADTHEEVLMRRVCVAEIAVQQLQSHAEKRKALDDMHLFGTGVMLNGKHVPLTELDERFQPVKNQEGK